jgi:tetratricopeptide (TPR) repeat protein
MQSASRAVSQPVDELRGTVQSLLGLDLSVMLPHVMRIESAPLRQACCNELKRICARISKLSDLLGANSADIRHIKTQVADLLTAIANDAEKQVRLIYTATLSVDCHAIVADTFGVIAVEANNAAKASQSILDPQLFALAQAAARKQQQWFVRNLMLLQGEAEAAATTHKVIINIFLSELGAWLKGQGVKTPGAAFISYSWPEAGSEEERWLQPFLRGLQLHLSQVGIDADLDIHSADAKSGIYWFMDERLGNAEFVLLVGTPSLLTKHLHRVSMVHEELAKIRRKLAADRLAKKRPGVIPINLSPDHQQAFPAGYEGYSNIRDWLVRDYLLNLQEVIGYIYQASSNEGYQQRWRDFFKQLQLEGYVLRESPQDRQLTAGAAAAARLSLVSAAPASVAGGAGGGGTAYEREAICVFPVFRDNEKSFINRKQLTTIETFFRDCHSSGAGDLSNTMVLAACSGMGGIGKTQIALRCFYRFECRHKIWVDAEDLVGLVAAFERMAVEEFHLYNWETVKKPPHQVVVDKVRHELAQLALEGCLVVFDNVVEYAIVEHYIPTGVNVLVTSRSDYWPHEAEKITLNVMTSEEACALMTCIFKQKGGRKVEFYKSQLRVLAKKLDHLPLALAMAANYIKHCRSELSLADYIHEYMDYFSVVPAGSKGRSIVATFEMAVRCVETMHSGYVVKDFLQKLAFLDSSEVPFLLMQLIHTGENAKRLKSVTRVFLDIILNYNLLMRSTQCGACLHRVFKESMLLTLSEAEKKAQALSILRLLSQYFQFNRTEYQLGNPEKISFIPHVKALLVVADELGIDDQSQVMLRLALASYYAHIRRDRSRAFVLLQPHLDARTYEVRPPVTQTLQAAVWSLMITIHVKRLHSDLESAAQFSNLLAEAQLPKNSVEYYLTHYSMGEFYRSSNEPDIALILYKNLQRILRNLDRTETTYPFLWCLLGYEIGALHLDKRDPETGRLYLEKAYALTVSMETQLGKRISLSMARYAITYELGCCEKMAGSYDAALGYLEQSEKLVRELVGKDIANQELARVEAEMGDVHRIMGNEAESLRLAREAEQIQQERERAVREMAMVPHSGPAEPRQSLKTLSTQLAKLGAMLPLVETGDGGECQGMHALIAKRQAEIEAQVQALTENMEAIVESRERQQQELAESREQEKQMLVEVGLFSEQVRVEVQQRRAEQRRAMEAARVVRARSGSGGGCVIS